ncbi:NAD(P)/FAD-dependent oxidoreductase [Planctomyces sp. SH-PL62]|uniref:NAD(P)/FAD-dependent oxidoreductase n=1 Tax=Planctomyces sp. SH-PL62 TaxID=1636152 RepID=UPI00078D75B8|nr:NAD(P)/FAD-dependent oxidoreductase [Planctomyces sp. SH-PL62]AMV40542.1 NADH dehydrogenase-like protein [Planctomyces sp. SH-PL62]
MCIWGRKSDERTFGDRPRRIVVIGAGFAGLAVIKGLRKSSAYVSVIDRQNHHLFQPLLYQVATASLNPSDIAGPIRRIVRGRKNTETLLADVTGIDLDRRVVTLADGEAPYDVLVLASGATHSYFGHPEWEEHAPGLKSVEDALEIRRRMLLAFEIAERETDETLRREWLTFVVVGGGPTGVELAGALRDVARMTLAKDFVHIDPATARVILVEGSPRVLTPYSPKLSESARRQLEGLGVEVRTGSIVTHIDAEGVHIGDERIASRTVLWAAGVAASPLGRTLGVPLDRAGRVMVQPDLTIPGHPEVYVIGDLAHLEQDGKPVPGVAPAAAQMGKHAAANIIRTFRGQPTEPFRYVDKGSMATIGRGAAVAHLGRFQFSGFPAWMLWLFVHVLFLIGFRNRLLVVIQWAWSYLSYDRGARLITGRAEGPLVRGLTDSRLPSTSEAEAIQG